MMAQKLVVIGAGMASGRVLEKLFEAAPGAFDVTLFIGGFVIDGAFIDQCPSGVNHEHVRGCFGVINFSNSATFIQ